MKYWGLLGIKMLGVILAVRGLWSLVKLWLPPPRPFLYIGRPFGHDLVWTLAAGACFLVGCGLLYLAWLDQRYRCRTCLRRLRMPVETGSWGGMLLFGRPHIEYICPYGHGTLRVPEVQLAGPEHPDWKPHHDIWEELESLEQAHR
ncbi:MAG: hypothetical protein ACP5U2_00525 [Bryobacteraceae bacterium]